MKGSGINSQGAAIFRRAAAYIRSHGWQKEGMGHDGQTRCSMGALASAYPKKRWDKDLARAMYQSLYDELNGQTLTQFNYKYHDGEKVAQLFERVANKLVSPKGHHQA